VLFKGIHQYKNIFLRFRKQHLLLAKIHKTPLSKVKVNSRIFTIISVSTAKSEAF